MRGVNKVILLGNLGADPELRYTTASNAVANIRLATNFEWTHRASGEKRSRTEWHRVVIFGKLAEVAGQYLSKGDPVYFEGRNQTRKWQGQDGQDRYTTEVVATEMVLLGGRNGNGQGQPNSASHAAADAPSAWPGGWPEAEAPPAADGDDFDDDIPF